MKASSKKNGHDWASRQLPNLRSRTFEGVSQHGQAGTHGHIFGNVNLGSIPLPGRHRAARFNSDPLCRKDQRADQDDEEDYSQTERALGRRD